MRVTFPRLPDSERAYSVIERDDGVVYRLYGGLAGHELPHDVRHLIVERELGIGDGLWGAIAAGVVFMSMRPVRGQCPPQAADRSGRLTREYRDRAFRAERLASLAEAVAALDAPTADEIRRLARAKLSALPGAEVAPAAIAAAARALQVEAARWARLRHGEELVYDWPRSLSSVPSRATARKPGEAWKTSVTYAVMGDGLRVDRELMALALGQARMSLESGGVPVGAVLASGADVIGAGHNERVQSGDPVAHGEISCLRNAGRRASYAGITLYTTLSPCQMCTGAILLFQIPRVVVGEARTFAGDLGFLRDRGVEIVLLDDPDCAAVMEEFQSRYPEVWSEDIGGR